MEIKDVIEGEITKLEDQVEALKKHIKEVEEYSGRIVELDKLIAVPNLRLAYWDDTIGNWHDMEYFTGEIDNALVVKMLETHKTTIELSLANLKATYSEV